METIKQKIFETICMGSESLVNISSKIKKSVVKIKEEIKKSKHKNGDLFKGKTCKYDLNNGYAGKNTVFEYTGEIREPKENEWFVGCFTAMKNTCCPYGMLKGGDTEILRMISR